MNLNFTNLSKRIFMLNIIKKNVLLLAVLLTGAVYVKAQNAGVPQKFNFTTQVTDSVGTPIGNTLVNMKATLTTGSPTGPVVYSEINSGTTSPAGIFTVVVGGGTIIGGHIGSVPWTLAPVYLSTAMDVTGGTNFVPTGTAQLISQPYSIVSGNGVGTIAFDSTGKLNVNTVDGSTTAISSQNSWLTGGNSRLGANSYLGTNDNTDLVLKSNGQEGLRISNGNTSVAGNIGIGGVSGPVTAAQVNGALALQDTVVNVSGSLTLNVSNRSTFLVKSSAAANSAACTLTNGQVPGQLLMIMVSKVTGANNGISFTASTNLRLTASGGPGPANTISLTDASVITFIWNGTQWLETSVSINK